MESFTEEQYQQLVLAGEVLSADGYGEKVILSPDGLVAKVFRLKRPWSSGLWKSYAVRFAENAVKLQNIGVPTLQVERVVYAASRKRHLVFYYPLAGETLRDVIASADLTQSIDLFDRLAEFLSSLHRRGVYFRSIHFGNLVVLEDQQGYGLIDVADMRFRRRSLGPAMCARNFRHLCRYESDRDALLQYGVSRFLDRYLSASTLNEGQRVHFFSQLKTSLPWFVEEIALVEQKERSSR